MSAFWKAVLKSVGAAVIVTLAGAVFAVLFGERMNGFSREGATLLGLGLYLCFVAVVCTGLLLARMKNK